MSLGSRKGYSRLGGVISAELEEVGARIPQATSRTVTAPCSAPWWLQRRARPQGCALLVWGNFQGHVSTPGDGRLSGRVQGLGAEFVSL